MQQQMQYSSFNAPLPTRSSKLPEYPSFLPTSTSSLTLTSSTLPASNFPSNLPHVPPMMLASVPLPSSVPNKATVATLSASLPSLPPFSISNPDVNAVRIEDAIHRIVVIRFAPNWLPFRPGSSYWVPPRIRSSSSSSSYGITDLMHRLSNYRFDEIISPVWALAATLFLHFTAVLVVALDYEEGILALTHPLSYLLLEVPQDSYRRHNFAPEVVPTTVNLPQPGVLPINEDLLGYPCSEGLFQLLMSTENTASNILIESQPDSFRI
ncbi:hypothetical protein LguiB_009048 [Lonicera macranthoides]